MLASVKPGKSIIDCATLTPERMAEMAAATVTAGGRFLEAPVSGSKAPAAQGALIFLCGGDAALYKEVQPDLEVMGKADFLFGPVGAGSKMKLVVNMVMGDMMVALSEGLALCGAAGLPCDADAGLLKVLDLGIMSNGMFRLKGPKMLKGDRPRGTRPFGRSGPETRGRPVDGSRHRRGCHVDIPRGRADVWLPRRREREERDRDAPPATS